MFYSNPWGPSDACQVPWPVPLAVTGTGGVRRVSLSNYIWNKVGTGQVSRPWAESPGCALIKSSILSSQPSTGDCNFRRNCCASFPMVITWFLLAKSHKPLVSAKVQLSGPGGSDLSCDLGLASPEEPSWGQMLQDRRWDSCVGSLNLLQDRRGAPSIFLGDHPNPQTGCSAWTHQQLVMQMNNRSVWGQDVRFKPPQGSAGLSEEL